MAEADKSDIHGDLPAAALTQGLADHKEPAAFAFQRTRMPIVVTDARQPDYPIVLANDSFLALTGYRADEVVGKNCRTLQGQATSRTTMAEIRAIIAQEREGTVEILNYRKDGSSFWNPLHLSPSGPTTAVLSTISPLRSTSQNIAGCRRSNKPSTGYCLRWITGRRTFSQSSTASSG